MPLTIETFVLGPLQNNTYLVTDKTTHRAAIIDPAIGIESLINKIKSNKIDLESIWITHAHFDHIAGANRLAKSFNPKIPIALHPKDFNLWAEGGGAKEFGFDFSPGLLPEIKLSHKQILSLGDSELEVRHTPGHTQGHVVFYYKYDNVLFCGDLIFFHSIGRTDLPTSNPDDLFKSIYEEIFTFPDETRLLSGHGPPTTVIEEKTNNPFL
ncbi:MAG TPA: MBL fold metallo-hydrolase [Anaerolineae bacterium]|nr:MBL fold metallo-hydrolase [Anaerolineae bacterium]